MARHIPYVVDGVLRMPGRPSERGITVDSPAWIAWLRDPATRSFAFDSPRGAYTARKERRARGDVYWTAYRKQAGHLHKVYLGKAEAVTLDRLTAAATLLAQSDRDGGHLAGITP